jgi:hypothetical protein
MGLYGRLDPVISIHNGAQYGSSAMSDGEVIYAVESFYHFNTFVGGGALPAVAMTLGFGRISARSRSLCDVGFLIR